MKCDKDFGMENFNLNKEYANIIRFIQRQKESGLKTAIIGISGGKDSTIVAKLLVDALGKENVIGVMMPNGIQSDIADSQQVCNLLGIKNHIIDIKLLYDEMIKQISNVIPELTSATCNNIPPRLRMTVLYAIAQSYPGGRVVGTGNRSEHYIGWCTKWGDMASDFNPIAHLTCSQVIALGDYLDLPYELVHKIPSDGLTGKSDEDNFEFTYEELDSYILEFKTILNPDIFGMIMNRHSKSLHKDKVITLENENS